MFITTQALEAACLKVDLTDDGLSIQGGEKMPSSVIDWVNRVAKRLGYSPQERDETMAYIANVTVWSTLKRITSV